MATEHPTLQKALALHTALEEPEKYVGYHGYSRVVAANSNFFITRSFRALNARIILQMQDDIVELEDELRELEDNLRSVQYSSPIHNGSFRLECCPKRIEILRSLKMKLKEYNDYVNSFSPIGSRQKVRERDIQSVKTWLNVFDGAIEKNEVQYLEKCNDLMYITPMPKSPIRQFCTYLARQFEITFFRIDIDEEMGYKDEMVNIFDEEKMQSFLTGSTLVVGLAMLIGPLWILEFVAGPLQRLAVITSFIVLFLVLLSVSTTTRPIESLAGTAGYSAVLMVFLQITPYVSTP